MSKRNIVFNRPEDPSFLKKIKESIGYREGPTVETKRQRLEQPDSSDSDSEVNCEREEEKPQVVVLKPGDLTADEAEKEQQKLLKEEAEKPADLSQKIVFKASGSKSSTAGSSGDAKEKDKKSKAREKAQKSKLSFNEDEEED